MGIVMVAMLAFGGTFAYFTATTTKIGGAELTTGTVSLKAGEDVAFETITRNIVPGDELVKTTVSYTSDSTVDTYVAIVFSYTAKKGGTDATAEQLAAIKQAIKVDITDTWEEGSTNKGVYVYKTTGESASYKLAGTVNTINFTKGAISFDENYKENFKDGVSEAVTSIEGFTITIGFQAYAVQADNFTIDGTASADTIWTAMKTALNLGA